MIKGLGDMASGMLGDAVSKIAGDAAGPILEQVIELVTGALAARDGGAGLTEEQDGALAQIAEAFGVGSPEEIVQMGAEKLGEVGVPDNMMSLISALSDLKS